MHILPIFDPKYDRKKSKMTKMNSHAKNSLKIDPLTFENWIIFAKMGRYWKKSVRFGMFFCFVAIWWAVIHIYSLSSWPVTRTNNQSAFDLANFISDLTTLEKMQSSFDQSKVIWNDS